MPARVLDFVDIAVRAAELDTSQAVIGYASDSGSRHLAEAHEAALTSLATITNMATMANALASLAN